MNKTALITGASSGIGLELAKINASAGNNLVIVAQDKKRLSNLKDELEKHYKITVYVIKKDLSSPGSAKEIYNELKKKKISIDYLINNAGFGDFAMFADADWSKLENMINLNITTLTHMTYLFIQDMISRGEGKIMNVASTAAFQSGPTMAVYYASKAFVLSFSEALNNEVHDKGITVTALCPGPTQSGFQAAAKMEESRLVKWKKFSSSKDVAEYGYKSMMSGKTVAIHGLMNYLMACSVRFFPRSFTVKITRMVQDKAK